MCLITLSGMQRITWSDSLLLEADWYYLTIKLEWIVADWSVTKRTNRQYWNYKNFFPFKDYKLGKDSNLNLNSGVISPITLLWSGPVSKLYPGDCQNWQEPDPDLRHPRLQTQMSLLQVQGMVQDFHNTDQCCWWLFLSVIFTRQLSSWPKEV